MKADQCERNTRQGGINGSRCVTDQPAVLISSDGISQIERYLYTGSSEHFASFGYTDNQYLFRTGYGKQSCGAEAHQ